jgi:hypothetical protein
VTTRRRGRRELLGHGEYLAYARLLGIKPVADAARPRVRGRHLPAWATRELVQTPAAREKLARLAAAHPGGWPTLTAEQVFASMACVGDPVLTERVARVIADRLPAPVSAYALTRVQFVLVGRAILGFCAAPLPTDRPWTIVVSYQRHFDAIVAHEVGHSWLLGEPAPHLRVASSFWMSTIEHTPIEQVPPSARLYVMTLRRQIQQHEEEVRALTRSWGFRDL